MTSANVRKALRSIQDATLATLRRNAIVASHSDYDQPVAHPASKDCLEREQFLVPPTETNAFQPWPSSGGMPLAEVEGASEADMQLRLVRLMPARGTLHQNLDGEPRGFHIWHVRVLSLPAKPGRWLR